MEEEKCFMYYLIGYFVGLLTMYLIYELLM